MLEFINFDFKPEKWQVKEIILSEYEIVIRIVTKLKKYMKKRKESLYIDSKDVSLEKKPDLKGKHIKLKFPKQP